MKKILLAYILLFSAFIFGCSALEKADKVVMSGEAERVVFNIEYTEEERQMILFAISEYGKFHDKWKSFIENPVQLSLLEDEQLLNDYENLRNIYLAIEHIVAVNFGRYNEATKAQLLKYQKMAIDVDETMGVIKTVSDVATYGALVNQVATKML